MVHAVLDALSPFGIKHLDMPMTPPRVVEPFLDRHSLHKLQPLGDRLIHS
jgi:hypothetical protein